MLKDHLKIWEALTSSGVPERDVIQRIEAGIFPWHARLLNNIRLLLGGNPFTPEMAFVQDLANCSSGSDIDEALFAYHVNPERRNRLVARLLGLSPRRHRVFEFYRRLKAPRPPRPHAPVWWGRTAR